MKELIVGTVTLQVHCAGIKCYSLVYFTRCFKSILDDVMEIETPADDKGGFEDRTCHNARGSDVETRERANICQDNSFQELFGDRNHFVGNVSISISLLAFYSSKGTPIMKDLVNSRSSSIQWYKRTTVGRFS